MICAWKTCTEPVRENPYRGNPATYCSKKCKSKAGVDRIRHRRKLEAIAHLGGKCVRCGYSNCPAALHFHHIDPAEKDFRISETTNWAKIVVELEKCILVCANCHAEEHWKQWNNHGS